MPTSPVIELSHVNLVYEGRGSRVQALHDINLAVTGGETIGVTGPSGSGKSSLMMILAGLERPTSGLVRIAGQDLAPMSEDKLARYRGETLGIVFQDFHLIPSMTAEENVALPLEFARRADSMHASRVVLDQVGLSHRITHYPGQLSGGEQQRVALARALVVRPRLLLADEPTGNLDQSTGQMVMDLIFSMAAETGAAVLLITHDPALAARCSRRIALRDGCLE